MKKIAGFLAIMLICSVSFAQSRTNMRMQSQTFISGSPVNKSTNDTLVNADTSTLYYAAVLGFNVQLQWTVTNITGTAGGTITYQGSPDGVTWYTVLADVVQCTSCTSSTTISGLTSGAKTSNTAVFKTFPWKYIRVYGTFSGTQTSFWTGIITTWAPFTTNLN